MVSFTHEQNSICIYVIAWFVVIFDINTTTDISKLLYVISRAARRVKFETILKWKEWYLCPKSCTKMLLFVYTTTRKGFVVFTSRYFKLSWNTTALSQSNCRNFSCSSISSQKLHRRKISDWSSRDYLTLPNSKWRQYPHRLFIPKERRLIAA